MDKDEIINKVKLFAKEASREFNIKKIILYGSFVNGNFTELSDIDVAIVLDDLPEDILNSEFKLYKMRRDIDHRIEPVIFAYGKDKSGFLEELLRTGLEIYPAA
jgi:predicted nucleotidyltransferase